VGISVPLGPPDPLLGNAKRLVGLGIFEIILAFFGRVRLKRWQMMQCFIVSVITRVYNFPTGCVIPKSLSVRLVPGWQTASSS
jgi:hypothetical protein